MFTTVMKRPPDRMAVDGRVGAGEEHVVHARGAVDELGHQEPLAEQTRQVARIRRAAGVCYRCRVLRETLVHQRRRRARRRQLEQRESARQVVADLV